MGWLSGTLQTVTREKEVEPKCMFDRYVLLVRLGFFKLWLLALSNPFCFLVVVGEGWSIFMHDSIAKETCLERKLQLSLVSAL